MNGPDPSRTIEGLRRALSGPLPGHDEFLRHAGYKRTDIEKAFKSENAPRESAVLALLFPQQEQLHTLLIRRPTYEGVHSGQIAFPGGHREPEDPSLQATALREFSEEVGATHDTFDVLGALSTVFIPPSRTLVTPFVAFAPSLGTTAPDPREVSALIGVPLADLTRADVLQHREQYIHIAGGVTQVPYLDLADEVVWGATAMMLWELRELLLGLR